MKMNKEDKVLKVIYKYWRYHSECVDEMDSLYEAMVSATVDEACGEAYAEEIVVYKVDEAGNTYTEVYDREGMDRYRHQHYKEHHLWEEWFKDWEEPEVVRKRQEEKQKKYEEYLNRTLTHEEMVGVLKKISNQNVEIFAYGKEEDGDFGIHVKYNSFVSSPVYSISEPYDQAPAINSELHQKNYDELQHVIKSIGRNDKKEMTRALFGLLKEAGLYKKDYTLDVSHD